MPRSWTPAQLAAIALALGFSIADDTFAAGFGKKTRHGVPCETCPPATIIESAPAQPVAPQEMPAQPGDAQPAPAEAPAPDASSFDVNASLDSAFSTAYNAPSSSGFGAPGMIGDTPGLGSIQIQYATQNIDPGPDLSLGTSDDIITYIPDNQYTINSAIGTPGTGGGVGRIKLMENTSILPTNRVFINWDGFQNTPLTANGTDVNRIVPGFEKTFFGGLTSVEVRVPFAGTLDATQNQESFGASNVELGNVTLFLKALLYSSDTLYVGGGLTITTPTANDFRLFQNGVEQIRIENDGTHLAPYVGILWVPGRFFSQTYFQYDFDATGRPALLNNGSGQLTDSGDLTDTSVAFLSWNAGYWLYMSPGSFLSGIAPVGELHYNGAIGDGDSVSNGFRTISDNNDNYQILNGLVGSHFMFGDRTVLTTAVGFPLTDDRQFEYEFKVMLNFRFGAQNPYTAAPPVLQ